MPNGEWYPEYRTHIKRHGRNRDNTVARHTASPPVETKARHVPTSPARISMASLPAAAAGEAVEHAPASASASPATPDDEARALLPPSTSPSPSPSDDDDDDDDDDLEERAYEATEKVVVSIADGLVEAEDGFGFASAAASPPFSWRKLWLYTGPGFLMSIAFLDPGNLEGDLQAGAAAGDTLLWLLLWATAMGLLVQLLAARLGVATGRHLAELCRDEYPCWARRALWLMAEVAMVGADIQEVIGSAIAIKILSRGFLPLWAGVVITAMDCFIFLSLENYGVRKLEAVFAILIATMAVSFAWMFTDTKPNMKGLIIGILVPKLSSRTIRQAVGVVGCVIMPHNVFLHSALVQSRKIDPNKEHQVREALRYYSIESTMALAVSFMINLFVTTVFAKGFYGTKEAGSIGLENAGQYLQEKFGGGFFPILYIWGIGLLAAGQSSTITGTYAGQFIMGGFLNLKLKKWIRSMITRSFAIVPTIIVALFFDASDSALDVLNEWLNVLQSIQIPFALIPLITLVSKEEVMGVFKIGRNTQAVTWTVATLLITINGYLLLDFFSSEIRGLLSGSILCLAVLAYASFVLYLILRGTELSNQIITTIRKSFS
ncbi:metal transporter Nramp6 [Oryza brachyantha]|nr:metal transporter Nramp6 [Oryza brachyantha]